MLQFFNRIFINSCNILTEEIVAAQNFDFAPKFWHIRGFQLFWVFDWEFSGKKKIFPTIFI